MTTDELMALSLKCEAAGAKFSKARTLEDIDRTERDLIAARAALRSALEQVEADSDRYRFGLHAALTALGEVVDWAGAEGFKQEWLGWLQSNADSMPEGSIEQMIDAAIAASSAKPGETR